MCAVWIWLKAVVVAGAVRTQTAPPNENLKNFNVDQIVWKLHDWVIDNGEAESAVRICLRQPSGELMQCHKILAANMFSLQTAINSCWRENYPNMR